MPKVDLLQDTEEWLSWRRTKVCATDASVIMHTFPDSWGKTTQKLWNEKLNPQPFETNEAIERGKKLEPEARELFIKEFGINMIPCVYQSDEYKFAAASLDGMSDCGKYLLEIKCMGEKGHKEALDGIIKPYYKSQVQHQLFVTRAIMCYYFCYRPEHEKKYAMIVIEPDKEYIARMIEAEKEFYRCMTTFEEPCEWTLKQKGEQK